MFVNFRTNRLRGTSLGAIRTAPQAPADERARRGLGFVSPFQVRRERLADDALVVVRGDELSVPLRRRDALRAYRRFGEYGVSVLGATMTPSTRSLPAS